MGPYDNPIAPHSVEELRRSLLFGDPAQPASIDRQRALALLAELGRLQDEHTLIVNQLQVLLDRLESRSRHPASRSRWDGHAT